MRQLKRFEKERIKRHFEKLHNQMVREIIEGQEKTNRLRALVLLNEKEKFLRGYN